jgi:Holliday junction resolvase
MNVMPNSRAKGARGEREFAEFLRERGYEARRGQQFSGGDDSPDVVHNVEGIHFEVKRTETLRLMDATQQAREDCGDKVPVVAWKRNRGDWYAVLTCHDLLALLADRDHQTEVAD